MAVGGDEQPRARGLYLLPLLQVPLECMAQGRGQDVDDSLPVAFSTNPQNMVGEGQVVHEDVRQLAHADSRFQQELDGGSPAEGVKVVRAAGPADEIGRAHV